MSAFQWNFDTRRYAQQVLRLIFTFNPMRVFAPVGGAILLLGLGKLGYDLATSDFYVRTNTALLIFMGFQIVMIGLLADVVARNARSKNDVEPATR